MTDGRVKGMGVLWMRNSGLGRKYGGMQKRSEGPGLGNGVDCVEFERKKHNSRCSIRQDLRVIFLEFQDSTNYYTKIPFFFFSLSFSSMLLFI